MKYDLITIGSGLVDAIIPTKIFEKNGEICFPAGQKIEISNINFSIGGGGINTAICAGFLGLKTGFLGKIGQGKNSDILIRELKKSKVDFLGKRSNDHTGYSIILDSHSKKGTILTYKGATNNLKFSEVNLKKLKTKWIHFTSMAKKSFKTQNKIAKFAKKNKIKISFNPSMYQLKDKMNLKFLINNSDVLSLNKAEAKKLLKFPYSLKKLCKGIHEMGPRIVLITNGNDIGGLYDGNFFYKFKPKQVKIVEATGAGDAFVSTFITGLIKNFDVEQSLKLAITNTSNLIQYHGAHNGLLSFPDLNKRMKKEKFEIKKGKL